MLPILGWVFLWRSPSWGFLLFYGLCIGVLTVCISLFFLSNAGVLSRASPSELFEALAIDFSWNVGVFVGIGAIIVLIRSGKIERMPSEREIDAELARIRGEAPPGPNQPEAGPSGHFRESSASDARKSLAAYGARLRSLSKRDALRWVFAGLAVVLVSWWAGTDHHLENLAYSLNVLEDFASWFTDNGIGFLVGGGVALYGGYRFVTAPQDSEKQDAPS